MSHMSGSLQKFQRPAWAVAKDEYTDEAFRKTEAVFAQTCGWLLETAGRLGIATRVVSSQHSWYMKCYNPRGVRAATLRLSDHPYRAAGEDRVRRRLIISIGSYAGADYVPEKWRQALQEAMCACGCSAGTVQTAAWSVCNKTGMLCSGSLFQVIANRQQKWEQRRKRRRSFRGTRVPEKSLSKREKRRPQKETAHTSREKRREEAFKHEWGRGLGRI